MRRDQIRRHIADEQLRRMRKDDADKAKLDQALERLEQTEYDRLISQVDAWLARSERKPRPVIAVELPEADVLPLTKGGRFRRLLRACWPFGKRG